jgi:8-oxo-dGTP diphosphatase
MLFPMIPESVSGAIFNDERRQVLLIQRRDVPVWVLPGGGIEAGETPDEAVIREILEETGFHVKISRLAGQYSPINRLARPTNLYECVILQGKPTPSAETRDVRFFPIDSLPPMPPPYLEWIQDALKIGPTVHRNLESVTYCNLFKNLLLHPLLVGRFLLSRLGCPINS